mgnify:CR=1 FL=1
MSVEYKVTPPTQEDIRRWKFRIKHAFKLFDNERNGTIPNTEVATVMRYLGYFPSEKDVVQLILPKMASEDGGSAVHYEAFEEVMLQIMVNEEYLPSTDDALLAAFRVIDEDGKGWISVNEISELLSKKGTAFRGQELAEFIQRARDPAQPNKIYYEDYVTAFTKTVDEIMSEADNVFVPQNKKKQVDGDILAIAE